MIVREFGEKMVGRLEAVENSNTGDRVWLQREVRYQGPWPHNLN